MLIKSSWVAGVALIGLISVSVPGHTAEPIEKTKDRAATETAKQVASEAAAKAIESLRNETRLDLDIRLISPTSVRSANEN